MAGPPPEWQYAFSAYMPFVTGHLSALGSTLIIFSILGPQRAKSLQKPHLRILLALSFYDLSYSLVKAWSFVLSPQDLSGWDGSRGNLQTCRFQGFMIEMAHCSGAYNTMLAVYFCLTICYGVKQETWTKYERYLHPLIFITFVSFAIAGLIKKVYNPIFGFCFISTFPPGCETSPFAPPCQDNTPDEINLFNFFFGTMWIDIYIILVTVANFLIWKKVRDQGRAMEKYMVRKQEITSFKDEQESTAGLEATSTILSSSAIASNKKQNDMRMKRERMVSRQCLLYTLSFFVCWFGPTAFHTQNWINGGGAFWQIAVVVTFLPLQGLFNAMIYAMPIYQRLRTKYPGLTKWQTFRQIFFVADPFELDAETVSKVGKSQNGKSLQRSGAAASGGGGSGSGGANATAIPSSASQFRPDTSGAVPSEAAPEMAPSGEMNDDVDDEGEVEAFDQE